MFKVATGAFCHARIEEDTRRVLDLGCGTGVWCETYALAHPDAQVIGVDIAPPQLGTTDHTFPPNCSFLKFDLNGDWNDLANYGPFDYVHARMLILAVRDWSHLFDQAYSILRPGGLFETLDGDVRLQAANTAYETTNHPAIRWYDSLREHMMTMGVNPSAALELGTKLRETGFIVLIDRQVQTHLDPSRSDLKEERERQYVADFQRQNWIDLLDRMTPTIFETSHRLSVNDGIKLAAEAREDLSNNGTKHGYFVTL